MKITISNHTDIDVTSIPLVRKIHETVTTEDLSWIENDKMHRGEKTGRSPPSKMGGKWDVMKGRNLFTD